MPLPMQHIPVLFTQGIDTKTDDKIVEAKLLEADNCVFTTGIPTKRLGYTSFSRDDDVIDGITEGRALDTFKDELLLFGDDFLRTYAEPTDRWVRKGSYSPISLDLEHVIRNDNAQYNPSSDINSNIVVTAWDDVTISGGVVTNNGVKVSVYTKDSETFYISNQLISSTSKHPRVVAIDNFVYIYYVEGTTLTWHRVSVGNPYTLVANSTTLFNDLDASGVYEVNTFSNAMVCSYKANTASDNGRVSYISAAGVAGSPLNGFPGIQTIDDILGNVVQLKTIENANESVIFIFYIDTSNVIKFIRYSLTLIPDTTRNIGTFTNVQNITAIETGNLSELDVFFDQIATSQANNNVFSVTISANTTPTAPTTPLIKSVALASKAFEVDNQRYFIVQHLSILQPTFFIARTNGCILGKVAQNEAGEFGSSPINLLPNFLPEAMIDSSVNSIIPLPIRNRFKVDDIVQYFTQGISLATLNFSDDYEYSADELNDEFITAGGLTFLYDGRDLVEKGFNIYPEALTAANPATPTNTGTYNFKAVYKWNSNQGKLSRSVPSLALLTNSNENAVITVPTLRLTEKQDVTIELYSTTSGGGNSYYKVAEVSNNKTVDTIAITGGISGDSLILRQEPLYTNSGELVNDSPEASRIVTTHKNRIFLSGLADPNKIQFSKIAGGVDSVEFNAALTLNIPPLGGRITALASFLDWLIIFKNTDIYSLSGFGPNNLGTGNGYAPPRLVASDVGCTDTKSVVLTPLGVMFKSNKGIYLLDKSQTPRYIGADVEAFNPFEVTSAVLVDNFNEVRFSTKGQDTINGRVYTNPILVYNYFYNTWSVFTDLSAEDATIWIDQYVYAQSDGVVKRETPNLYKDDGRNISMRITTNWIRLTGYSGFQRVSWINFVGEYVSKHQLAIDLKYNYQESGGDRYYYFPDGSVTLGIPSDFDEVYGGDAFFGDESQFGGTDDFLYNFRLKPRRQKCAAIQVTISDVVDSSIQTGGESFNMSALTFAIGAKQGIFKHKGNKTI